jgi:SpoVK/Ycf46/Vps4 family AAA+-type ATPase
MEVYRNYVFMGPSGVGKTTWARLMGQLYKHMGIYMYGSVAETSASDYVGAYIGWSAPQTQSMLDQNLENIVLIDEAYAITETGKTDSSGGYGSEAITAIVNYMDKNRGCVMIIIAGYEPQMKTNPNSFLKNNEGLDRRFPNQFVFPSYTAEQLVNILKTTLKRRSMLDRWEPLAFSQLLDLIQLLVNHDENRRRPEVKAEPRYTSAAPFYDELFSKQGGSIENIANEIIKYMSLPDKNPSRWEDPNSMTTPKQRRTLYNYKQDMVQVLASKLDRKWHEQLRDKSSQAYVVLLYPVLKNTPGAVNPETLEFYDDI